MTKFLAFIGWLIITGAAFWWAYLAREGEWTYTIIAFISMTILLSIFSSNKKKANQGTTVVYVQPQDSKTSHSGAKKINPKQKTRNKSKAKK